MIDYVLLGLLTLGPRHAYARYQELRRPDGRGLVWRLKFPRLYAMLDRLKRAGLIRSELVAQSRRPTRRVFHLTPNGATRYSNGAPNPSGMAGTSSSYFRPSFIWPAATARKSRVPCWKTSRRCAVSGWRRRVRLCRLPIVLPKRRGGTAQGM